MKRLLIAVDESEGSRSAVGDGLELARRLGAAVTFVYVRPSPPRVLGDPYYSMLLREELRKAQAALDAALGAAESAGVGADAEILEGDPADEIVGLADNKSVDLIVVGSRGLGPIAGALLGSVSRAVTRHSNKPVLVTKSAPRAETARRVA